MRITDWIVVGVIFGLLATVYFFDRWVKKHWPDQ
jgi:hypothetical protein